MEFKNTFYLIVLYFAFLSASNAEVQLPLDATNDEKKDDFKNYINRDFKPVFQQVLDASGPGVGAFLKNINPNDLHPIHEDRENGTPEDALSKDRSTPLRYKDVNNNEMSALDDQTDIHLTVVPPPSPNSKTEILPTEIRGVPPKYLRRARRQLRPLHSWIPKVPKGWPYFSNAPR